MKELVRKIAEASVRCEDRLLVLMSVWFWSAFIAMFFEGRFQFLHPFVLWTFRIYLGIFVAFLIGLMVVAPGFLLAEDLHSEIHDPKASRFEKRLTWLWCGGGGLLLTLLIAAAYGLEFWGPVKDVKVWFIALCWTVLMIPYAALGYLVRRFLRRNRNPKL